MKSSNRHFKRSRLFATIISRLTVHNKLVESESKEFWPNLPRSKQNKQECIIQDVKAFLEHIKLNLSEFIWIICSCWNPKIELIQDIRNIKQHQYNPKISQLLYFKLNSWHKSYWDNILLHCFSDLSELFIGMLKSNPEKNSVFTKQNKIKNNWKYALVIVRIVFSQL